jgi:hypothetical protein
MRLGEIQKGYFGRHNAFTDLKYFGGYYYLVFRHGGGHIVRDGTINVTRSEDGKVWEIPAIVCSIENGDARDPHFFVNKGGGLSLIFVGVKDGITSSYISNLEYPLVGVWSFRLLFKKNFVAWRPVKFHEKLFFPGFYHGKMNDEKATKYGCKLQKYGSRVYVDGTKEKICADDRSNEVELFEYDGELYALVRIEQRMAKIFKRSRGEWELYMDCGFMLQGPCVKVIGERVFIVGREALSYPDFHTNKNVLMEKLVMRELDLKNNKWINRMMIIQGLNLDCGYAALEQDMERKDRLLLSFYCGTTREAKVLVTEVFI